ncbi:MAG: hypothetical protein WDN06_08815 [Asticcacaulis sp.]
MSLPLFLLGFAIAYVEKATGALPAWAKAIFRGMIVVQVAACAYEIADTLFNLTLPLIGLVRPLNYGPPDCLPDPAGRGFCRRLAEKHGGDAHTIHPDVHSPADHLPGAVGLCGGDPGRRRHGRPELAVVIAAGPPASASSSARCCSSTPYSATRCSTSASPSTAPWSMAWSAFCCWSSG